MAETVVPMAPDGFREPGPPGAGREDWPVAEPPESRASGAPGARLARRPEGLDRVAAVGTFKAPLADTIQWVHYHRNIGIEALFLFFDDPADAVAATGPLADRDGVYCFGCDEDHWRRLGLASRPPSAWSRQEFNADLGRRLAAERGIDWLIHIDSDELVYAERGLRAALSAAPGDVDVVGFRVLEAVPEAIDYESAFREITLFRDWPRAARYRAGLARAMGCGGAFLDGKYFRGHQLKSAVRVGTPMRGMGNHVPYPLEGREYRFAPNPEITLLHYDCGGFEAWMRKWLPRVEGRQENTTESSRVRQAELIRRALGESRERTIEVYKEINFLKNYEKRVLLSLGLLRRVSLPPDLFEGPLR